VKIKFISWTIVERQDGMVAFNVQIGEQSIANGLCATHAEAKVALRQALVACAESAEL
jgi:hypothetical protein